MKMRTFIVFLVELGKIFVDIICWPKHLFTFIREEIAARKSTPKVRSRRPSHLHIVRKVENRGKYNVVTPVVRKH